MIRRDYEGRLLTPRLSPTRESSNPGVQDFRAMFAFFRTGRYVADPSRQGELFGPVPTAGEAVERWADRDA